MAGNMKQTNKNVIASYEKKQQTTMRSFTLTHHENFALHCSLQIRDGGSVCGLFNLQSGNSAGHNKVSLLYNH